MLAPPLLAVYFLFVGFLLFVLAFLLYRQDPPRPELRFATVVTGILGVVSLTFSLLLWREIYVAAKTADQAPAPAYVDSTANGPEKEQ